MRGIHIIMRHYTTLLKNTVSKLCIGVTHKPLFNNNCHVKYYINNSTALYL